MSKAEKFIEDCTKNCSNLLYRDYIGGFDKIVYQPWLTPDQARRAVEIAREEVIDKAIGWIKEHKEAVETEDNGIIGWIPDYFIEDFKQAMKDENRD